MKVLLLFFIMPLLSCSLIEPTCLIIQNDSQYTIFVSLNKGNKREIILEDGHGDFILIYPGTVKLSVYIEVIDYQKNYSVSLNYLEKKKFVFSIDIE